MGDVFSQIMVSCLHITLTSVLVTYSETQDIDSKTYVIRLLQEHSILLIFL